MKLRALSFSLATLFVTHAYCEVTPVGDFGHEFTSKQGDVVWTIRPKGNAYELLSHGDQAEADLQMLPEAAIRKFWDKMFWPESTALGATCLGNDEEIFCHVPKEQRKMISWLADYQSDFFYYSEIGGIMQIQQLGP